MTESRATLKALVSVCVADDADYARPTLDSGSSFWDALCAANRAYPATCDDLTTRRSTQSRSSGRQDGRQPMLLVTGAVDGWHP